MQKIVAARIKQLACHATARFQQREAVDLAQVNVRPLPIIGGELGLF
jgi:hypothetical protein